MVKFKGPFLLRKKSRKKLVKCAQVARTCVEICEILYFVSSLVTSPMTSILILPDVMNFMI